MACLAVDPKRLLRTQGRNEGGYVGWEGRGEAGGFAGAGGGERQFRCVEGLAPEAEGGPFVGGDQGVEHPRWGGRGAALRPNPEELLAPGAQGVAPHRES